MPDSRIVLLKTIEKLAPELAISYRKKLGLADPDVSSEQIDDKGFTARAVDVAETADSIASNTGSAAALLARAGATAPIISKAATAIPRIAAPVTALLQGVDAARIATSADYREASAKSLLKMADDPLFADSRYFNVSAAMQALGRAPATIYALGHGAASGDTEENLPPARDTRPVYSKEREDRKRDVPEVDITQANKKGAISAAKKLFRYNGL